MCIRTAKRERAFSLNYPIKIPINEYCTAGAVPLILSATRFGSAPIVALFVDFGYEISGGQRFKGCKMNLC